MFGNHSYEDMLVSHDILEVYGENKIKCKYCSKTFNNKDEDDRKVIVDHVCGCKNAHYTKLLEDRRRRVKELGADCENLQLKAGICRLHERIKQHMEDANKKLMEDPNKKGWRWAERRDGDGQSTSAAGSDQPS